MNQLPPDVTDALQRGQVLEAIKRLRKATGLGLKEAKDAIEARQSRAPAAFSGGMASQGALPQAAIDALRAGNKIEAIRLVREHAGLGLKQAKDKVDGYELQMPEAAARNGLSPGEVARSGSGLLWAAAVAVLAVAGYFFLR